MPRKTLNVGMVGYGFMGRAHSNAWRKASTSSIPAISRPEGRCGA
jgi:predicted dehydrogenase